MLSLRPVPKIHTRWSALSSSMSCIVADEAGNGKVPKGRLRRVSEQGLPALPRFYRIEVMQDAVRELAENRGWLAACAGMQYSVTS